jgi:type VI secretion system protein ImpH
MDATVGRETDAIAFLAALAEAPYRYDFYQTLRRLECLYDTRPRWGQALRPVDEPVRLGQDPDLSFAPAPLAAFGGQSGGTTSRLQVRLVWTSWPQRPTAAPHYECARIACTRAIHSVTSP